MIENDVITYLEADATLDTLLGPTATDSKFNPEFAPAGSTRPYVEFSVSPGVSEEILDEERIVFRVYADTKAAITNILERLKSLLDKQDEIQGLITSTNYYVYYSRLSYETLPDFTDVGNPKFVGVATLNIKIKRKTWY